MQSNILMECDVLCRISKMMRKNNNMLHFHDNSSIFDKMKLILFFFSFFELQMLDMIMPKKQNVISLQDLKRCRMTPIFFDTFFNLEKYLDHEQRDPFASQRDVDEDGNEVIC